MGHDLKEGKLTLPVLLSVAAILAAGIGGAAALFMTRARNRHDAVRVGVPALDVALGEILYALLRGLVYALIGAAVTGFAVGFALWGAQSAMSSGTFQALVFDDLAAEGKSGDYVRLARRRARFCTRGRQRRP